MFGYPERREGEKKTYAARTLTILIACMTSCMRFSRASVASKSEAETTTTIHLDICATPCTLTLTRIIQPAKNSLKGKL